MTHSLRSALSALVISLPVMLGAAAASTAGEENLIIKPSPHDVHDIRGEARLVERAFGLGACALAEAMQVVSERLEREAA